MLDWRITLQTVALVAFWSVVVGFFWSLGCKLFALICGGSR